MSWKRRHRSASNGRCRLERLCHADRVSAKKMAGSPKRSLIGPVSTQKTFLARSAPIFHFPGRPGHLLQRRRAQRSQARRKKGGEGRADGNPLPEHVWPLLSASAQRVLRLFIWYMYVWCGMCTCMYVNVYCTFVDTPSLGALIEQNMGVKMCICEEDGY